LITKSAAKFQILVFLSLTFTLSWAFEYYMIKHVGTVNSVFTVLLMWVPGLCGLLCMKMFDHNLRDIGLRTPSKHWMIVAYTVPAIAAVLILVISVLLGIGEFQIESFKMLINRLVFTPTFGVLLSLIFALGEEIGWRGFLYARIHDWDIETPNLLNGIIWAVWYWPLILFLDYAASPQPAVSLVLFTISIVAFSVFQGQLRRISKSVWAPALAHAVHNTWVQSIYPSFYKAGALNPFFGGEAGVILAVLYLLLAIYLQKKPLR
jgi:membrane protease YdiL (CAAX protease family)